MACTASSHIVGKGAPKEPHQHPNTLKTAPRNGGSLLSRARAGAWPSDAILTVLQENEPFPAWHPLPNGAWDPLWQGWQGTEAARGCPGAKVLFGGHTLCQPEPQGTEADLDPSWHGSGLYPLRPAPSMSWDSTHPAAWLCTLGRAPLGDPREPSALPRLGGWDCVLRAAQAVC